MCCARGESLQNADRRILKDRNRAPPVQTTRLRCTAEGVRTPSEVSYNNCGKRVVKQRPNRTSRLHTEKTNNAAGDGDRRNTLVEECSEKYNEADGG